MRKIISIIVTLILYLFIIYLAISDRIVWLDFWTGIAIALTTGGLGTLYWGFAPEIKKYFKRKRIMQKVDPNFAHLTILYSQRGDSPDTENPARPRLVLHNKKKITHWVSTVLEPLIAKHKIPWHTFDDEKALRNHLKKEKIESHNHDPDPKLDLEIEI